MSGIDWEEILDAEGADLQSAYDGQVWQAQQWDYDEAEPTDETDEDEGFID